MGTQDTQGWPPESSLDAGDADEADASGLYDTPGERWYSCDRCGFLFRSSETIIEEVTGFRVCTSYPNCHDEIPDNDPRVSGIGQSRMFHGDSEEVIE